MKIEVGKTYETRDGHLVCILCTDARGNYSVIGLLDRVDSDVAARWASDGRFISNGTNDLDLVREHVPVTYRWYRVFKNEEVGLAWSKVPILSDGDVGLIKLAFDPSGNLVIDKCEITGAQPNG